MKIMDRQSHSVQYYIQMNRNNILFNELIVGPTNSSKTQYFVNQLRGPFPGKFGDMILICPTFVHTKTYERFDCPQEEVELWRKLSSC